MIFLIVYNHQYNQYNCIELKPLIFFMFAGAVEGMQTGQFPDDNQPLKCYTLCIMKAMRTVRNKIIIFIII